jgi:hypothetical protein
VSEAGELFRGLVERLTRASKFYGFYLYEVQSDGDTAKPSLVAVEGPPGLPASVLPDQLATSKAHGLPGATSTLVAGTQVLLGFMGGNPGRPFVAFYLPGQTLPPSLTLDASSTINLGASGLAAARAPALQTWAGLVETYLGALDGKIVLLGKPTSGTPPHLSSAVAASKVRVE